MKEVLLILAVASSAYCGAWGWHALQQIIKSFKDYKSDFDHNVDIVGGIWRLIIVLAMLILIVFYTSSMIEKTVGTTYAYPQVDSTMTIKCDTIWNYDTTWIEEQQ